MTKKLSLITINYNNAAGLQKTFKSVLPQLVKEVEYIVIDGGSADESRSVIEQNSKDLSFWVSEKDNGIYNAQNKGIDLATGQYCLFLNSGDVLATGNVISEVLPRLQNEDIIYGDVCSINADHRIEVLRSPEVLDVPHFMVSTLWHPSAFIKTDLFKKWGKYREDMKVTGDYEFFIRAILVHGASTRHIPVIVAKFDLQGISNSKDHQKLQNAERKKSWELNFEKGMINTFEDLTRFKRSREYKVASGLKKFIDLFRKKK
jgi:glycosyltransferase involved in cell wall biosynthesis